MRGVRRRKHSPVYHHLLSSLIPHTLAPSVLQSTMIIEKAQVARDDAFTPDKVPVVRVA
jgi:hypothetical protein